MKIIGLPALVGSYDNYIWVLYQNQQAWVVDPGESKQVLAFLQQQGLQLQGVLITHFHHDHVSGIGALKAAFPQAKVYGSELPPNPLIEVRLKESDRITLTDDFALNVLFTPGHTEDHISYYNDDALFCGDTLFSAGCGRKFTGTFAQFTDSIRKLRALPDNLNFYSAHEYTLSNLKFAYLVEPGNAALRQRILNTRILYPEPLEGPQSTLGEEKATNPFLRFDQPAIKAQLLQRGAQDTAESLFKTLREWKDDLDQSGALDQMDLQESVK